MLPAIAAAAAAAAPPPAAAHPVQPGWLHAGSREPIAFVFSSAACFNLRPFVHVATSSAKPLVLMQCWSGAASLHYYACIQSRCLQHMGLASLYSNLGRLTFRNIAAACTSGSDEETSSAWRHPPSLLYHWYQVVAPHLSILFLSISHSISLSV
eukprot:scpid63622/ scgid7767/ 